MFNFTLKRSALVLTLALFMGMGAAAQTFLYEGICYKATGNKLKILDLHPAKSKDIPKPENGTLPDQYSGDVVIPESIVYNGVTYTVSEVGSTAFKESAITSFTFSSTITKVGKGIFQGCTQLTNVHFSTGLTQLGQNMFNGCSALSEISLPGIFNSFPTNFFKGCTSLTKITFEDGEGLLDFNIGCFGLESEQELPLKELYIYKGIDLEKNTAMADKPFRGAANLEKVVIGGSVTEIPASYFENCSKLKNVTFEGTNLATIGTNVFSGTAIEEISIPESVTSIASGLFASTRSMRKVTLGNAVTNIDALAFNNSSVSEINFPATLTSIGDMAFSGSGLTGNIAFSDGLKTIGAQAFATSAGITGFNIPASVTRIGDGFAMGCPDITSFTVDAANETYASSTNGEYIQSKDGKRILCFAPKAAPTEFTGNCTEIAPYAFYGCTKLNKFNLNECNVFGDYSLYNTGATELTLRGTVGRYVAAANTALTTLTINTAEIPFGVAAGNTALTTVNLPEIVTVVKQEAFKDCTALKSVKLGGYLAILESDCFAGSGITDIEVAATFPPAMASGVFTEGCGITATVPAALVNDYKNADGWKYLNIVGNTNLTAQGADMGMPNGLYYAGDDNALHCAYADGKFDTYDVGSIPHTFQLLEYSNRIYGASAGEKFVYSDTGATDGDGKLFYISKVGGQIFQAVVLDNTGNNAYKDPFGLYLYGEDLYVNDRNVCIRVIPASAIALPQNYPSWMENNWMGFYGQPWQYGCIKCGFAITQTTDAAGNPEPLYWVGMKYNGNGIFRFRQKDIMETVPEGQGRPLPDEASYLTRLSPVFTTFNVDAQNGHLYLYIETMTDKTPAGLYRVNLADIEATPNPSEFAELNPVLIDGSPVKYEGSGANEHVGISQLAFDADQNYMYWCYRAPENAEEAALTPDEAHGRYAWAEAYDENNPLHHSGIKRIKLGEANPTVEMVVPGVSGYGIAVVNYEGSTKPESGIANVVTEQPRLVSVANGTITANDNVELTVYTAAGLMVAHTNLTAGESYTPAVAAGVYVVVANNANASQTLKMAL